MLFDSSVLIEHLRGEPRARAMLRRALAAGAAFASVVSRAEVEGGMPTQERGDVARLFEAVDLLPVTDAIARRAGRHLRRHRASHPGIDLVDYLIGSTAEEHGLELATLNVKHFPMIEGLRPPW